MFVWKNRKVAITGGTGFIGHHVALDLCQRGAHVVALVRPTSDVQRIKAVGVECRVASLDDESSLTENIKDREIVVHMAGAVGFGNGWDNYYQVNVQGTRNLVQAAQRSGVVRFIHTSSIVAVGAWTTAVALDETADWKLGSFKVPYVTTKRWGEETALKANGRGMEVVVVNPASVVGPDDFAGSEFGVLCRRFWKGRIPFHFGGGNNFVDVRDVAQGIRLAAERGRPGERYLLAGTNRAYHAFFGDLCRAAGRAIPRVRLPSAVAQVIGFASDRLSRKRTREAYLSSARAALMGLYFFFDASKARRELGYETRPLGESLADAHTFWMSPPVRALSA